MLTLRDEYWLPMADELQSIFQEMFFDGFFRLINTPLERFNEAGEPDPSKSLVSAMRDGRVSWKDGVYSGKLNARLSGELRKIAHWDERGKQFTGSLPDWLKAPLVAAESRRARQIMSLEEEVRKLETLSDDAIGSAVNQAVKRISAGRMQYLMDRDIDKSLKSIGISIEMTPDMREAMRINYLQNQARNIKSWTPEQIRRLREMIRRVSLSGYNRDSLQRAIMDEYGVSEGKARFLARQEASLFMSALRRERYLDAGCEYYKWRCTMDERSRPMHKALDGLIFRFGDPPVTDDRGNRNEPGEDFNCRCIAIPLTKAQAEAELDRKKI